MSIQGASFNPLADGARMNFFPGNIANVFGSGHTVAVLAKVISSNFGMFGGYSDSVGGTYQGSIYLNNNSGGRLYGNNDFSDGFPSAGADADGLNDSTWRWFVLSKTTGSTHYRFHYADLSTLVWAHGESGSSANHSDGGAPCVVFSTGAIYAQGFNAGDIAAIAVWPSSMSDGNIEASCTRAANDLIGAVDPEAGWLFIEADFANYTYRDFTGGFADETSRLSLVASADPPGWTWHIGETSSLFNLNERPGDGHNDFGDGDPGITTGVTFTVSEPGEIRAIRFVTTAGADSESGATYTVGLYHVTASDSSPAATLLGSTVSVSESSLTQDAWNEIALPEPVPVVPGVAYRAAMHNDVGRYVANNSYFSGFDKVSDDGKLTAHHDGDNTIGFGSLGQGTFILGATFDYPRNVGTSANYWIDVVFGPSSDGPPAYVAGQFTPFFMS